MIIKELAELTNSVIKVKDGWDGKVLCYRYQVDKHNHLADREVLGVWAEIDVAKRTHGFDSFAKPIICVYVVHKED